MKSENWFLLSLIGFVVALGLTMTIPLTLLTLRASNFKDYLIQEGYEIKAGIVESPSLIVPLDKDQFCAKAKKLGTPIYTTGWAFYVFEDNMLTAYKYHVGLW